MNRALYLIAMLVLVLPGTAGAKPTFPEQIQQHLGIAAAPGCVLCHASDAGGGPISQSFGQAMIAAGLTSAGGDTLTKALDKLEADGTDSNGDGIADVAALREKTAPTTSEPTMSQEASDQGCSTSPSSAPRGHLGRPALLGSALLLGVLAIRGSRRQR